MQSPVNELHYSLGENINHYFISIRILMCQILNIERNTVKNVFVK